jgi:cbb3-type cytochrome oxidase maturation protein
MEELAAEIGVSFFLLLILGGFLLWGLKTRQFHNPEETKYRILENEKQGQQGKKNDN